MITTIYGEMDETELIRTDGIFENEIEKTTWVEYRKHGNDEVVHRSAHVTLKELTTTSFLGE